jgi:hypothetical protein
MCSFPKETMARLSNTEPLRRVAVTIALDLTARVDTGLIRLLFEHLLGNAWKFTRNAEAASIHFGVTEREGWLPTSFATMAPDSIWRSPANSLFLFRDFTLSANFPVLERDWRLCSALSIGTVVGSGPRVRSTEARPSTSHCRQRIRMADPRAKRPRTVDTVTLSTTNEPEKQLSSGIVVR